MVQSSSDPPNVPVVNDDLESLSRRRRQTRRKQIIIVGVLAALVVLGVVLDQTLRHTFFALRTPNVRFSSVAVENSNTTASGSFRMRLEAQVAVKNTNFGRFEYYYSGYGNLSVGVFYRGAKVGQGVIAEGTAGARSTKEFGVTLDLSSAGYSGTDLRSDVNSGSLPLSSKADLTGAVHIIGIIRKQRDAQLSCTMTVKLDSNTVHDLACL